MSETLPTVWLARHGDTAWSALGYDHDLAEPAIRRWNDTRHVGP